MSGLPSPLKSPPAISAVKRCQPEPIWARPPKPPWPSPRYRISAPSDRRARRSGLPSPLQSPGASSAVNGLPARADLLRAAGDEAAGAVAAVHQQRPSPSRARMSGLPSPSQSRGSSSAVNGAQPEPICSAGRSRTRRCRCRGTSAAARPGCGRGCPGLPSPLQSPVSSAVNEPQPVPIPSPAVRRNPPAPGAAVEQQPPVGVDGEHVGGAVAAPVRRRGRGEREGGEGGGERGAEHRGAR